MDNSAPILVAEDNDDDFFFFRRAVRAAGLENAVLRFRDGSELVDFLQKLRPNEQRSKTPWLLFIDISMPMMNGFEVLEWIAQQQQAPSFVSVILSGSSRPEDIKRALALGAQEYLVKPIAPAVFAALALRVSNSVESAA
jgi:CheY-like chemotaxis protein